MKKKERVHNGNIMTDEQNVAIDYILSGKDTVVQAPAGSGKTETLRAASAEMRDRVGLYIAFNKAIADSAAASFTNNTDCRTGHSLAFRAEGRKYIDRLGKITGMMIAKNCSIGDTSNFPTEANKGYVILDTIRRFCYSNEDKVEVKHVPVIKGPYSDFEAQEIRKEIVPFAQKAWEQISDVKGKLPITHDTYLKVWALSKPQIDMDFILFDEFQDANPVILGVVANQKNTQNVFIGDKFQQIYGWRGAVNALEKVKTDYMAYITQSFRFGQGVADMANKILSSYMSPYDAPPPIIGYPDRESIVTMDKIDDPDVVLCRTNTGVITNIFKYLEDGKSVYVQGGVSLMVSLLRGADDLMNGKRTYVSDLSLFHNWEEVVECSETESGADLRSLVSMIKNHGIPKLLDALNCTHRTHFGADITITTAHKSKGLEWGKVRLYNDFLCPDHTEDGTLRKLPQSEINLLYVACTRALHVLDISSCIACHPEMLMMVKNSY